MDSSGLQSLNAAQTQAVLHPPDVPLQILAGPGSGKTKVLTSRIAYLIAHHRMDPDSICAVTFTNKAAAEMRHRLEALIGRADTRRVRMGTFHALCAMFLRKHGAAVGLEGNFTICDAEESKKLVGKLLKPYKKLLAERDITLQEGTIQSVISKAKAKDLSPEQVLLSKMFEQLDRKGKGRGDKPVDVTRIVSEIYAAYNTSLRTSNSLDFDDLLVFGVRLFREDAGRYVRWCKHILVDEFQDTNSVQYKLMLSIASSNGCITIVGDPDQSIYGWRSAEVENLAKMQRDFPRTVQIFLEDNYRSTGSILALSLAIVNQDKSRIQKSLRTSHPASTLPTIRAFANEHDEAQSIASEISRLMLLSGGILTFSDFAILLRFSALSRTIESALQRGGIPHRVLGGHRFFDRLEIKDLLAYLQLVDNPQYIPAFLRTINVPPRGIGDKTVAILLERAEALGSSPFDVVERICDSRIPDIKPPIKKKAGGFVEAIRILRKYASEGKQPADLLQRLIDLIGYQEHLRKTQQDFDTRWENIAELINFAMEAKDDNPDMPQPPTSDLEWHDTELDASFGQDVSRTPAQDYVECREVDQFGYRDTPLRIFLQSSMLSTDTETAEAEGVPQQKVTISTCHAAKGLEWPVVMIPAVEKGVFPSSKSEDILEERRVLYVACTRAQGLLYLSHVSKRMVSGITGDRYLSEFVSALRGLGKTLHTTSLPDLTANERIHLASILVRPVPDEAEVSKRVSAGTQSQADWRFGEQAEDDGVPDSEIASMSTMVGFASAKAFQPSSSIRVPRAIKDVHSVSPPPPDKLNIFESSLSHYSHRNDKATCESSGIANSVSQAKHTIYVEPSSANVPAMKMHPALSAYVERTVVGPSGRPTISAADARHSSDVPPIGTLGDFTENSPEYVGAKRRLGIGAGGGGYKNKKFRALKPAI